MDIKKRPFCLYLSSLLIITFFSCTREIDDDAVYTSGVEFSAKMYMKLNHDPLLGAQGATSYGDYFVQAYNYNKLLSIYDLKDKKKLGDISISAPPPNSRIHCNTINFGTKRYESDDFFPLLYVNSGYSFNGNQKLFVYRILSEEVPSNYIYRAELVQTITFSNFGSWTEGIIDNENNYVWVKYEKYGTNGPYGYAKYLLPDVHSGDVNIEYSEFIDDFTINLIPANSSNQCHMFYHDRIILVSGGRNISQPVAFIAVNTISHEEELVVNLQNAGLKGEPESIIRYNDQFMIGYSDKIYSFSINYFNQL